MICYVELLVHTTEDLPMHVVSTAPALAFDYLLIIVIWPAVKLKI